MGKPIIHKELYTIANLNRQIEIAYKRLKNNLDADGLGLGLENAYFISDCYVKDDKLYSHSKGRLDNGGGIVDNEYYCCQHTGYCEDDYYGTCYFPTNTPGLYVAVPFNM